ncbi:DUF6188 family protein (plasmid) [Streptomyces sp. NBC_01462]|nr:DUF6188 family protein [Streptomyces sp. NBC_01462]
MSTDEGPVEHEDQWVLNLRGMSVTKISVDFRLVLILNSGCEVALEAPVSLSRGTAHASPSGKTWHQPLLCSERKSCRRSRSNPAPCVSFSTPVTT